MSRRIRSSRDRGRPGLTFWERQFVASAGSTRRIALVEDATLARTMVTGPKVISALRGGGLSQLTDRRGMAGMAARSTAASIARLSLGIEAFASVVKSARA